ncbi:DNA polymerase III subunit gamma/tau [Niveibacterium terrae]|uniref:DNA polymerase III subunit gamma/tau n=1 Tax=Niveibacterium terrae TaxID=3373598 RepID=UPI003A8E7375
MSYLVLARKWRPKSFATLVGQEHVVRALSHALATGRLHHAYLFTGTRGVGKTTISRILAKALNCEQGVSATPCGVCAACQAIDAGRFVDYVEMDAASNRGVDDMAALLDRAAYAPTQGRYKVYMIDEVHQLTGHAFNAMLKTLEEPPEHMKFILATTDPQKIPVTVLSRCLQFNLKQMPPGAIVDHLGSILQQEGVPFEAGALRHLARGANGSMRDALSLLDQAIAHGAGKVEEAGVRDMLGTVGEDQLFELVDALQAQDLPAMLAVADAMQARTLSFDAALQAFASLLNRIALVQFAPDAVDDPAEREALLARAALFDPEFLQLAYQIAIHGRDDLPLAPDPYTGFTMTLLRLHAFRPERGGSAAPTAPSGGAPRPRAQPVPARPAMMPAPAASAAPVLAPAAHSAPAAPQIVTPPPAPAAALPEESAKAPEPEPDPAPLPTRSAPLPADGKPDWYDLIAALALGGMVRELALNCELLAFDETSVHLRLSGEHKHLLAVPSSQEKLQDALSQYFGRPHRLTIETGAVESQTPAERLHLEKTQRKAEATALLQADPFVREVIERFDATLIEASVKAL